MPRPRLIARSFERPVGAPISVRNALGAIVAGTLSVVITSALAMRALDPSEYKTYGKGLWWAIQTVTTVGYGDVTPVHVSGRIVAAIVMIWGTAYLAILTATITSTFVARAEFEYRRREAASEAASEQKLEVRLEDLDARLERIEQALARLASD
ncbi:MAG TPA: potassium channel family protein [Gaiellaceae bacterium]|nr:potassium channel family protein [Gaiellaceae bacterium]